MTHKLGCDAHQEDLRDLDARELVNQRGTLRTVSLRARGADVWSQVGPSCAASAVAGAISVVEDAPIPPAPLFLFYGAKRLKQPTGVIAWGGSTIRDNLKVANRMGCPDETQWPQSKLNLYRRPTFAAQMAANGRRGITYHAIKGSGDERIKCMLDALREGHPIIFSTVVSESFLFDIGPVVETLPQPRARIAGRHAMVVVGCIRSGTKRGRWNFEARNSWGKGWRDRGHVYLDEGYLADDSTEALYIITGGWRAREATAGRPQ